MRRLWCLVIIGALAVAVSVVAVGRAGAAKGGNKDAASQCQHGGWKSLVSQTGEPFKNQGDRVNDGAQGLGVQPAPEDPQTACLSLPGRPSFSLGNDGDLWTCFYESPPGPAQPTNLERVCAVQSGGVLTVNVLQGTATADCTAEGPRTLGRRPRQDSILGASAWRGPQPQGEVTSLDAMTVTGLSEICAKAWSAFDPTVPQGTFSAVGSTFPFSSASPFAGTLRGSTNQSAPAGRPEAERTPQHVSCGAVGQG
jgi:hypothetical protein